MSQFTDTLTAYGVNLEEIMDRFVDDIDLYKDCLIQFSQDPSFYALKKAINEKNYTEAFDQAHTMKGVSANLGLVKLYDAICEIVEPLRHQDYANLLSKYQAIMDQKAIVDKLIK